MSLSLVGPDILNNILSFSTIPIVDKYRIDRSIDNISSLNPQQLVMLFDNIAKQYRLELNKMNISDNMYSRESSVYIQQAIEIVKRLCSLSGRVSNRIKKQIYYAAALNSMYHVYKYIFSTCGLNPSDVNYPDGAYIAAIIDMKLNIPMAAKVVNAFESKYPTLKENALNGMAETVINLNIR